MKGHASSNTSSVNTDEVRRLVSTAEAGGDPDSYTGKRGKLRFSEGMQLEVTDDPARKSAVIAVTMHNVSESGCAFWSKRKQELRDELFVREFTADNAAPWLPVHVTHCTQGIRGFLVGVAFGERVSP